MTETPPAGGDGSVALYVRLWARDGRDADLAAYEDRVLALLPDHGARVVGRAFTTGEGGAPAEVQLLEFPAEEALDRFLRDDRRTALAAVREAVVDRTELVRVRLA